MGFPPTPQLSAQNPVIDILCFFRGGVFPSCGFPCYSYHQATFVTQPPLLSPVEVPVPLCCSSMPSLAST